MPREHEMEHNVSMKLRVGVNCRPVVAGVIGKSKYIYDLWGDTVNLAGRMESGGLPDAVQSVYEQLRSSSCSTGAEMIEVKGKGSIEAWHLQLFPPWNPPTATGGTDWVWRGTGLCV